MKFLCTIPSLDHFTQIKDICDGVVITNHLVSSHFDSSFSLEEITQLVKKCNTNKIEVYLLCNAIFTDEQLDSLYELIDKFKDTNLMYIFGDLAVYQILNKLNITKKGVYNPDTLIANYLDFTFWKEYKIKGLFPSLEIPLESVRLIGKNRKVKLFYKGFGLSVMFHSKRELLSSYKKHKNIMYDFVDSSDLYLVEETRSDKYKIIQNEHGTHIFQPGIHNILPALDIIDNEIDYLFLDGTYLNFNQYLEAVSIFKEALYDLDHLNYYNDKLEKIFESLSYHFLFEDSVFKKGDF